MFAVRRHRCHQDGHWASESRTAGRVTDRTQAPVIASGGVSSLDDLRAYRHLTGAGSRAPSGAKPSTPDGSPCRRRWTRAGVDAAMDLTRLVGEHRNPGAQCRRSWWATAPIRPSVKRQRLRHRSRSGDRAPSCRRTGRGNGMVCTAKNSRRAVDSPWVWVLDPIDGTFN